ncbi:MAG: hypothetical protein ACWGQW_00115 [bacterium]
MGASDWATINHVCPELKVYSRATLAEAAAELRRLPSAPALRSILKDYTRLREACRIVSQRAQQVETKWRQDYNITQMKDAP